MTTPELSELIRALAMLVGGVGGPVVGILTLLQSRRTAGEVRQVKRATDGMSERLEEAAFQKGIVREKANEADRVLRNPPCL